MKSSRLCSTRSRRVDPGAPLVHPDGNLLSHFCLETGDLAAGFAGSEVILTETFDVPRVAPAYLEARPAAAYQPDGSVTVWVSSQQPFEDQRHIAAVLGIPAACVQVKSAAVGGAFAEEDSEIAILAALGAWTARRGRCASLTPAAGPLPGAPQAPPGSPGLPGRGAPGRHPGRDRSPGDPGYGRVCVPGPGRRQPADRAAVRCVPRPERAPGNPPGLYQQPSSGAVRGFGSPQAHFRRRKPDGHAGRPPGDRPARDPPQEHASPGRPVPQRRAGERYRPQPAADRGSGRGGRRRLEQIPPAEGKIAGTGFALAVQSMGLGAKVPDDPAAGLAAGRERPRIPGSPGRRAGAGRGRRADDRRSPGDPPARVHAVEIDTRVSPDGGVTCASRMTYLVGNSLLLAAEQLKRDLLAASAPLFGAPVEQLAYEAGAVVLRREAGEVRVPVAELTGRLAENGVQLETQATFSFPYPPETTPMHLPPGMPHVLFGFGGQVIPVRSTRRPGRPRRPTWSPSTTSGG